MARLGPLLLLVALFGCDERERYPGLPPNDGGPPRDGGDGPDAAGDTLDGAADPDAEPAEAGVPLECGYPEGEYGYRVGRALEPFWLDDCDGELTTLPRLWCGHGATILHVNVAWCGSCLVSTHHILTDVLPELEGESVGYVEILVEENPGVVADGEVCWWWHDYFTPNVTTHVPADGELDGPLLWLASEDALPLTIVLDRRGEIRVWSALQLPDDLVEQIRTVSSE